MEVERRAVAIKGAAAGVAVLGLRCRHVV